MRVTLAGSAAESADLLVLRRNGVNLGVCRFGDNGARRMVPLLHSQKFIVCRARSRFRCACFRLRTASPYRRMVRGYPGWFGETTAPGYEASQRRAHK